jgi:hypothetical protein
VLASLTAQAAKENVMENRDSGPPKIDVATGFSAAAQSFQAFADEIDRISQLSFAQNAKLIQDLTNARDIGDLLAIQTKFAAGLFETFQEQFKLLMSRMAEFQGADRFAEAWPGASVAQNVEKAVESAPPTEPSGSSATDLPTEAAQTSNEATVLGAVEEEEDSAIESARQTTKVGREAWQELAKVAAELIRAESEVLEREAAQQADPEDSSDASARQA